jgi:glycosyltransferase involved in cell wall biosynthesis
LRIAVTHPYSWPEVRRGAERIIVETAGALARRGHAVTILTAGTEEIGRRTEGGVTTIKVRRRFADSQRHELWFGARVMPLLLTGRYDAVHAMMPADALGAIAVRPLARHRVLYEELGIPDVAWWREPNPGHPPLKDRPARHIVARRVDVYGCMSQYALDAYERLFATGRGALVPGGVDLERFEPATTRAPQPTLLFSGVLDEPRKGVSILLDALAIVATDEPDVRLWLSGPGETGPLLAAAPEAARERTEVLDLGDPLDQATRYGQAWATVLPSTFESFGMVLVESLACGTPIVVANHSAPPELARDGAGCVTDPGDPASLAAGLRAALALARDPLTVERCRTVAADYSWDRLAEHLEHLYARRAGRTLKGAEVTR